MVEFLQIYYTILSLVAMCFITVIAMLWLARVLQANTSQPVPCGDGGNSVNPNCPNLPTNSCKFARKSLLVELSSDILEQNVCRSQNFNGNDERQTSQTVLPLNQWTEDVACMSGREPHESYCVFTNTEFADRRGISLFTAPKIAEHLSELPAFNNPGLYHDVNVFSDSPWEVKLIPGKGNGLFATRDLQHGELIVAATPVGIYQSDALANDYALGYVHLRKAFVQLPKLTQKLFMSAMAHYEGDPIMERINTNAFSGEFQGFPHFLLYPETARMNHACRPNTMATFDPLSLIHTTRASRKIKAGEEITLAYMNTIQSRAARQEQLQMFWGFQCDCHQCSASTSEIHKSDARIARILKLQQKIEDWSPSSKATPTMAEQLIKLYQKEELYEAVGLGFALAALAHNGIGATDEAVAFARRALNAGLGNSDVFGTDDESMVALAKDPFAHWSWNRRKGSKKV